MYRKRHERADTSGLLNVLERGEAQSEEPYVTNIGTPTPHCAHLSSAGGKPQYSVF